MHVPLQTAEAARAAAKSLNADCCIAIGGGSTIGLAKAIALDCGLPILAVPTTFSGSEMTPVWGLTEGGIKTAGRDVRVLPKTVIYDPELTLSLPPAAAGTSGINAMAHAVEALYAEDANPVASLMAEESLRALAASLPKIIAEPANLEARGAALYGAWLAGMVLSLVGVALHHKLCHTLGGSFGLPHAEMHTLMLPHTAAYNAPATRRTPWRVSRAPWGRRARPAVSIIWPAPWARKWRCRNWACAKRIWTAPRISRSAIPITIRARSRKPPSVRCWTTLSTAARQAAKRCGVSPRPSPARGPVETSAMEAERDAGELFARYYTPKQICIWKLLGRSAL